MDLTGQLLIAMPGMGDPRFMRAVVFISAYSDDGAMGLIVNKTVPGMKLHEVLTRLDLPQEADLDAVPVYLGGPVDTERGFVLHTDTDRTAKEPLIVPGGYVVTATQDILEEIGRGEAPEHFRLALGYAGWGPGQLDRELAENGWLTAPATHDLVFGTESEAMWDAALRSIGIDPVSLSGTAGRA